MRPLVAFLAIFLGISFAVAQRPAPKLIDEFGNVPCDDWLGRLDLFLAELSNSEDRSGVVVLYEGKYVNYTRRSDYLTAPVFGEVHLRANLIRNHFTNRRFDLSRITFVSGGFRDEHLVELWSTLRGGNYPKPKPTRETLEYRKGKPSSIFPSCP